MYLLTYCVYIYIYVPILYNLHRIEERGDIWDI